MHASRYSQSFPFGETVQLFIHARWFSVNHFSATNLPRWQHHIGGIIMGLCNSAKKAKV